MSLEKDYLKDLFTDEVKGCLKSDGDPIGTAANAVSEHNTSEDAHSDIRGLIELEYDELRSHAASDTHITPAERIRWNAKSDFSGSYNDLSDKPTIPTVPTQVSAFNNDAGYLTQHQDISGKANTSDLTAHTGNNTLHIKADERTKWNAKAEVLNLISDSSQTQVNFTPAEIAQAVNDGKILMGLGGVCTLLDVSINGDSSDYADVVRPFNDGFGALLVSIAADKSYSYNIIQFAPYDILSSHVNSNSIHVSVGEKTKWNAKSDFSGSYNDLKDKPTIPTVPTKVSAFTNDAGYLTQHQDISGKANASDLTAHTGNSTVHVTAAEKAAWNKNALPSVSPSDSGKILMVNSSGVPAWSTITNAEGVSY